jgi:hypothetical protein
VNTPENRLYQLKRVTLSVSEAFVRQFYSAFKQQAIIINIQRYLNNNITSHYFIGTTISQQAIIIYKNITTMFL